MGSVADDIGPATPRPPARTPVPPVRQGGTSGTVTGTVTGARTAAGDPGPGDPGPRDPGPRPAPAPAPQPVLENRRYRQTIHRVDLWSVLKISVCFYISAMAVLMVALVALWAIADAAGVIRSVEKFFGDLLQTKNFTFLSGDILRGTLLVAAVLVVLLIVITVIAAAFYNLFSELFGGVEITISEDETAL
jgi:hypothetical protein